MTKKLTLCLLFILLLKQSQAQIAIAVAKENDFPFSAIEYRVEWGYGDYFEAQKHACKYLENKGDKKVHYQPLGKAFFDIDSGYYAVIKANYTVNGKTKISYGLGVSDTSQAIAEKNAIINLSTYDGNWLKSNKYTIDKQGTFDNSPQRQLICMSTTKTSACGDNVVNFSYMKGTYDNKMYMMIYKGFIKQNTDTSTRKNYVRHILRNTGYFAILKCNQKCSDNTIRSFYKVVEADTEDEIKLLAPFDATTISEVGETKYFLYSEIMAANDKVGGSIDQEAHDYLYKLLINKYKKILEKWKAGGIRG
ncbi:MAG: hypothetical protein WCO09_03390 [bacterium]